MCFVLLLHRVVANAPTVLVANRDESWTRPSAPPRRWPVSPAETPFVAPVDELAGGTWLGINAAGTVIAVTNRPSGTPDPTRESRGRLVTDLLRIGTLAATGEHLRAIDPERYNPCNLLVADSDRAVAFALEGTVHETELEPGMHVLTNRGEVDSEYMTEVTETFDPVAAATAKSRPQLEELLLGIASDRTIRSTRGEPICQVHEERGTVSTTLIVLGSKGRRFEDAVLRYADDAPRPSTFRSYDDLLRNPG